MKRTVLAPLSLLFLTACASAPPLADPAVISGVVYYEERGWLPFGSVTVVTLADLDGPHDTSRILGRATVRRTVQPIPFSITYDAARIDPAHAYGISASITGPNRVLFGTPEPVRVLTGGAPVDNIDVLVHGSAVPLIFDR